MPHYILALDQGTTSSRSILFDAAGKPVATAQREFTQYFPRSGWVEHDAEEIWATQAATITEVLARARMTPQMSLPSASPTSARRRCCGTAARAGRSRPRSSGRTAARPISAGSCRTRASSPKSRGARACCSIPIFPAPSSRGCSTTSRAHVSARKRGELAFGTIDSWLVWKLTNGARHVTDVSNASRTLLLNITSGQWDDFMLERLRIPRAVLPQVVPSSASTDAPVATLGAHSVPIAGIAGDQQAALFGQACFEPGMAKNTYGTGCFLLMNTGTTPLISTNRLLTTIAWRTTDLRYALEGAVFVGGAVVQWLRDGLGIIERSAEIEALAASVPDAGGVYLVPAFTGLGSPHWDAYARGTMVGLSRGTTRAHIARAALEAIAFQSAEVLRPCSATRTIPCSNCGWTAAPRQ